MYGEMGEKEQEDNVGMRRITDSGLDMPNIFHVIRAQRLKFLCRILSEGSEKWKFLPRMYLMNDDEQYGEKYYVLRCINDANIRRLPVYYGECVEAFHVLREKEVQPSTKREVLAQYLWGNQWTGI